MRETIFNEEDTEAIDALFDELFNPPQAPDGLVTKPRGCIFWSIATLIYAWEKYEEPLYLCAGSFHAPLAKDIDSIPEEEPTHVSFAWEGDCPIAKLVAEVEGVMQEVHCWNILLDHESNPLVIDASYKHIRESFPKSDWRDDAFQTDLLQGRARSFIGYDKERPIYAPAGDAVAYILKRALSVAGEFGIYDRFPPHYKLPKK